ncbi:phage tail tape-measure protein, partial [Klebsiella pneumoniae]
ALGEANERAAISIQKRKEAEQGQKYAKQEIASAQTTVDPSTGQAVDPLAQINLQEQQKLDALAKYQEIDKQNTKLYEDAKTAIMQQASYQRQAILLQEQQTYQQNVSSLLGESSNFAGSLADAIGQAAGKSSAAYQALFAISKGFAIAQASLNLQ